MPVTLATIETLARERNLLRKAVQEWLVREANAKRLRFANQCPDWDAYQFKEEALQAALLELGT